MRLSHALLHATLIATLFSVPVSAGPPATESEPPTMPDPDLDRLVRQPFGFAVLAIERDAGVDVSAAEAALARVVEAVQSRAPFSEPREALAAIAQAAPLACPTFVDEAGGGLVSGALRDGACDCDILVVTYLTVADVLGLPLAAVFLPGHVLIRWDDGSAPIYWETTVPEERPAWLVEALIPKGAEQAYLRPQSRREMLGYALQIRANYRFNRGDTEAALADFDRAVQLSPSSVVIRVNRARALLLAGHYEPALADYDHALRLDPTHIDAAYGRGLALIALGRHADALATLEGVEARAPAADVSHATGLAYVELGRDDEAWKAFDAALALDPAFVLAYESRGALHERRGEVGRARRDYAAFVRLAMGTEYEASVPEVQQRLLRLAAS